MDGLEGLARVRARRVRERVRDESVGAAAGEVAREVRGRSSGIGAAASAWGDVVPPRIAAGCRVVSFSRGVLTVWAGDAPARYALSRFLRGGGELALARRCRVALRRVRVVGGGGEVEGGSRRGR